ncbi:MAG TPA: hypothetical protein VFU76_01200 [Terriglobales bacterium]|nr:hypothetical protein [Terriglobales bacterium]
MKSARWAAIAAALVLASAAAAQTVPAGTPLNVRIIENLSSDKSNVGDAFHGTLAEPLVVNGRTVLAKGTDVSGTVTRAHPSGRLSDPGVLELTLNSVNTASGLYPISAPPLLLKGESHTKSNVTKIGGGAAAGAILGGIFGGGKGAAIGAGAGAAAGTGVAAATGKKDTRIESEAILTWTTSEPMALNSAMRRGSRAARSFDDRRGMQSRQAAVGGAPLEEFSDNDRQTIRSCFQSNTAGLPPGLAKRDRLPPGLERQIVVRGTLPPGLRAKMHPCPVEVVRYLPPAPVGYVHTVIGGNIVLVNSKTFFVMDVFHFEM